MTISPPPAQERANTVRTRDALSSAALNSLAVHVAVLGSDGRIVAVNDAWRRFAAENGAAHHHTVLEGADYLAASSDAEDADATTANAGVRSVLDGEVEEFRLEYPCHSPTELRWFELRATPVHDPSVAGAVVVHSIITQRKLAEQRLDFLAHHDELTGLANRRRMMEALAAAQPTGRLGVLLIDLDHFKAVNDTHGHAAGNEVLCAVARAMGEPLPGGSLAGRHGGDEFCMALFDTDLAGVERAAAESCARARRQFAALPFAGAITMSVGGTLVRPDEPLAEAMQRADEALYTVKGSGRDGHRTG